VAIRKPQRFLPAPGTNVLWRVVRVSTGDTIQQGTYLVGADGLVKAENITIARHPETYKLIFINPNAIGIIKTGNEIPEKYSLSQNYPNPFNPVTKIKFNIASAKAQYIEPVRIIIYDILGREVTTLVNEQLSPGKYEVTWDASDHSSGVYYYRIVAERNGDKYQKTLKMILVK